MIISFYIYFLFVIYIININTNIYIYLDTNMNLDSIINERVIWNFTIGIPILKKDELYSNADIRKKDFDDAVYEITEELTEITDGLIYQKVLWHMGK